MRRFHIPKKSEASNGIIAMMDLLVAQKELGATNQYIHCLHLECDWLITCFDMRKEARDGEIDALGKAKAVLSGADYSLVQLHSSPCDVCVQRCMMSKPKTR